MAPDARFVSPVDDFLAVEHDNEAIAVDCGFDRVQLTRNDLHVMRCLPTFTTLPVRKSPLL